MTWKTLNTMREVRLTIGQIVIPGIILGAVIATNPVVRTKVKKAVVTIKDSVHDKYYVWKMERNMKKAFK